MVHQLKHIIGLENKENIENMIETLNNDTFSNVIELLI